MTPLRERKALGRNPLAFGEGEERPPGLEERFPGRPALLLAPLAANPDGQKRITEHNIGGFLLAIGRSQPGERFQWHDKTNSLFSAIAAQTSTAITSDVRQELTLKAAGHAQERVISALTESLTLDEPEVAMHSNRVAAYGALAADILGFKGDQKTNLLRAAMLHDIGKIGIPENLLHAQERLDPVQMGRIGSHIEKGETLIRKLMPRLDPDVVDAVKYHHERWDGTGHFRKKGADIPEIARALTIVDALDSITTRDFPDKPRRGFDAAIQEIRRHAGVQFDPGMVEKITAKDSLGRLRRLHDSLQNGAEQSPLTLR